MKTVKVVAASILACLLLSLNGCGDPGPTMAENFELAGDVTSCVRNQLVEPQSCATPPDFLCSRPFEECAFYGCRIDGEGSVFYPDFSWRDPNPGPGAWSVQRIDGFEMVSFGDNVARVAPPNLAIPGCD